MSWQLGSNLLIALVLSAGAVSTLGAAPVAKKNTSASSTSATEAIRKALDQSVSFDFAEQPIHQVLQQIAEQQKITIVLDRQLFHQLGVDPNEVFVQLQVKNVKLRNALRTMLNPYGLHFAIVGDSLLITSEEMAWNRQFRQRVNIELEAVPLGKALKDLSRETATNIVLDPRSLKLAQTPISLELEDVPLESAVRLIAEVAGLKPVRVGNVLFVTAEERADKLKVDSEQPLAPWFAPRTDSGGPGMPLPPLGPGNPPPPPGVVPGNMPPAPGIDPMNNDR